MRSISDRIKLDSESKKLLLANSELCIIEVKGYVPHSVNLYQTCSFDSILAKYKWNWTNVFVTVSDNRDLFTMTYTVHDKIRLWNYCNANQMNIGKLCWNVQQRLKHYSNVSRWNHLFHKAPNCYRMDDNVESLPAIDGSKTPSCKRPVTTFRNGGNISDLVCLKITVFLGSKWYGTCALEFIVR